MRTLKYHLKWRRRYVRTIGKVRDREVYHEEILPYLSTLPQIKRVLDIGCEWYNLHHRRLFRQHEYWTIDLDAEKAGFGSRNHIVGSALELDKHFEADSFDLVLCNGVFGWGVNESSEVASLAEQVASMLVVGGKVVVGWNPGTTNVPELSPSVAMSLQFDPWKFPPQKASSFIANRENGHTFEFFAKKLP
ncbi:MAG: class I SAM-dependent methyltransferase [Verrucomicrobiota bacterium]